jgi:hypothetical protein
MKYLMAIAKYIIVVNYSNIQIIRPQKLSDENTTVLKMQFLAWTRGLSGLRKSMSITRRGHRDVCSAVGIAPDTSLEHARACILEIDMSK